MTSPVTIIGGGLAGCECAYQLASRDVPVRLLEMRPQRSTPAHQTGDLAELVCSNSFRSDDPTHAAGLLKREMEALGSVVVRAARRSAVPAGSALAVDRQLFAARVASELESQPLVEIIRRETKEIPDGDVVIATGPLTSPSMSDRLAELIGDEHLYFYDSIAPIVTAESLDMSRLFWASRYGKGSGTDYLNSPLDRAQYLAFHHAVIEAEVVPLHEFEKALFFEGCLPIEELARRGLDTLRFGPMKPVGLELPEGGRPWAVVQLRREDLDASRLNLVGFQSRMKWGEQKRVFRMLPGLEGAGFVRLGQVHRNTFVNAPSHLDEHYRLRRQPRIRLAGQITGVEGYLESAATGLALGVYLAAERAGFELAPLPATTALGALSRHLVDSEPSRFQPANINFGLFAPLDGQMRRRERRAALAERARDSLLAWSRTTGTPLRFPERAAPATS